MPKNDPDRVLRDIGRRLSELRTAKGLTQEELAALLNRSPRYVQMQEAGHKNVTVGTLVLLANALGVRVSELFSPPVSRARRAPGRPRKH